MPASAFPACRLGVLAFGDSITNGGGELQFGVALQSWALWVARGLGVPFSGYAVDGARAHDVVAAQIPAFERQSANPSGRYELGCLYIGVNDVRAPDWNPAAFEARFREALSFLGGRCDRLLTATAPLDLGRPRAGEKVRELNAAISRVASETGALVLDLSSFGARNLAMADHVHPTALGQIAIAERALVALERDGVPVRVRPSSLISYETTRWQRLRGDTTYLYRHAKVSGPALATAMRSGALATAMRSGAMRSGLTHAFGQGSRGWRRAALTQAGAFRPLR
jgi:lysophospholipase L1-like esterase